MPTKYLHTLLYIWLCACPAFCQKGQEVGRLSWEAFVEAVADECDEEYGADEEMLELLYERHTNPMDINEVRKEDLAVLPFLSEEQVEELASYVAQNGPVVSLGELMFVRSLGKREREMLRLFVEVPPKKGASWYDDRRDLGMGKLLKYGKSEVVWRTDVPFYRKAGYEDVAPEVLAKSPNKVYQGDRFHHAFRYAFSSQNRLLAGVNLEKDAGERGVDYVSGYVMWKDLGVVKRAIAGDYRLSFGKGLAVNSSMKFGKMMMLQAMDRMGTGITKHSSTSETGFFRGGAVTLRLGPVEVSAFGSYRKDEGTYTNDSTGMSSLKTDGLHRTHLERSKKGNLGTTHVGGNIHWEHHGLQLSATGIATHLAVPLTPKHDTTGSLYRYYNAHGQDFQVGSMAYAYRYGAFAFSGETAFSHCEGQNGTATLNALRWRVDDNNVLTLIGRYYGAKFVSLNGKAFGENASVQNEGGLFLGWSTASLKNLAVETFVDAMYFPWMKYQVSDRSYGIEGQVQATYASNDRWNLLVRYRVKSKQKDFNYMYQGEEHTALQYKMNHNLRVQLNYTLSPHLTLRTSATGIVSSFGPAPNEKGFAIGGNLRWQNLDTTPRIDLGITYFNTDSYDCRIYQYEPSLLYSFASSSYYDHGLRATLLASVPIVKQKLFIHTKLGMTKYFNKESIGTGLELIDADHREDLQVQVRWKF